MRVAALYDVHGDLPALEAALGFASADLLEPHTPEEATAFLEAMRRGA